GRGRAARGPQPGGDGRAQGLQRAGVRPATVRTAGQLDCPGTREPALAGAVLPRRPGHLAGRDRRPAATWRGPGRAGPCGLRIRHRAGRAAGGQRPAGAIPGICPPRGQGAGPMSTPPPGHPQPVPPTPTPRVRQLLWPALAIALAVVACGLWLAFRSPPDMVQAMADADSINVSTKISARVAKLLVREGDRVEAGQLLFELDSPEVE